MKRHNFEPQLQTPRNVSYERKGVISEIVIPLLACILFGLGLAVSLAIIQWGFLNIQARRALEFGGWIGLLAAAIAVTWRFFKSITWFAEEATRRDLDRDGWIGEPTPEPEPRIITLRAHARPNNKRERLKEEMADFIQGCEIDTSMRRWAPHLGRDKYLMFRTVLMEAGHAEWCNGDKRQGWELTAPANDIIASLN